jgi:response regulator RpfG family c-di-GMP phosphodiesterase
LRRLFCTNHEAYNVPAIRRLKGEEIPLEARLCQSPIVPRHDQRRPYRAAMSEEEAFRQLQLLADKQFDPVLVRFLSAQSKNSPPER